MKFVCPYCHQELIEKPYCCTCPECSLLFRCDNGIFKFYDPTREDWKIAIEANHRHVVSHKVETPAPCTPGWPYNLMPLGEKDIDLKVRVAFFDIVKHILYSFLDARKDAIALDIGAFTGWSSYLLAKYMQVVTVDVYEPAVALINTSIGYGIVPVIGDGMHLPLANNSIDLVFLFATYHHMTDRLAALDEWWRVLKFGGKLILLGESHLPASHIEANKEYAYDMGEFCYTYEEMQKEFDMCKFWDIKYLGIEYCEGMEYKGPGAIVRQERVDNGIILANKW